MARAGVWGPAGSKTTPKLDFLAHTSQFPHVTAAPHQHIWSGPRRDAQLAASLLWPYPSCHHTFRPYARVFVVSTRPTLDMAATRTTKASAIGSAQWILEERHQSNDSVAQEVEDFSFSVRNEMEWLNEHMADIFAFNGQ